MELAKQHRDLVGAAHLLPILILIMNIAYIKIASGFCLVKPELITVQSGQSAAGHAQFTDWSQTRK